MQMIVLLSCMCWHLTQLFGFPLNSWSESKSVKERSEISYRKLNCNYSLFPNCFWDLIRDAYGFAVRPQHLQRYKEYASIYKVFYSSLTNTIFSSVFFVMI